MLCAKQAGRQDEDEEACLSARLLPLIGLNIPLVWTYVQLLIWP